MNDISLYEKVPALKNNFGISARKFIGYKKFRPHWHEHYELLYFTSGSAVVTCNGKDFAVAENDLVMINSTEVHTMYSDEGTDYFCIIVNPSVFADIAFSHVLLQNHIPNDTIVRDLFYALMAESDTQLQGSDMMMKSHLYALMAHLMRNYTVTHITPKEAQMLAAKALRLEKVLDYITRNYTEKLTTNQLSDLCYLNESYFCRFFKKNTGKTVLDYINELRIEKAAVLLSTTNENVSKIATAVGFESIPYFSRSFKKFKNISPQQYRKETQQ